MEIQPEATVGQIVAGDYRTAGVFQKFGIDFCCKGNITVQEVCEKKKLDSQQLISALMDATRTRDPFTADFQAWPPDLLTDYIEKKHHRYVEERLPEISRFLYKVVNVHGAHHPELKQISELFHQSAEELSMHMKKEELILFPYIRKLFKPGGEIEQDSPQPFGSIENPIRVMMSEHNTEGERFRKIAELSNGYTPPPEACNTYKVTYALLKEFEEDLHCHIHLENNLLFPKSIVRENAGQKRETESAQANE